MATLIKRMKRVTTLKHIRPIRACLPAGLYLSFLPVTVAYKKQQ